jgi:hypothetical protein
MKNVVFLDYDGVVNRKMWTKVGDRWECCWAYPEDGAVNDPQAVQWVSEFCERFDYGIVVNSTWREQPNWESCLRAAGLRDRVTILGATSLPLRSKEDEISDYLSEHPEIESYLVFSDDTTLMKTREEDELSIYWEEDEPLVHGDHLVRCQREYGFGEKEYATAVAMHMNQKYQDVDLDRDENKLVAAARELLDALGEISAPLLQRIFRIGYGSACLVIEKLSQK